MRKEIVVSRVASRSAIVILVVLAAALVGGAWVAGAQTIHIPDVANGADVVEDADFIDDEDAAMLGLTGPGQLCGVFHSPSEGLNRVFLRDAEPSEGPAPGCEGPTFNIVCQDGASVDGVYFGLDGDGTYIMNYEYTGEWFGVCALFQGTGGDVPLSPGVISQ